MCRRSPISESASRRIIRFGPDCSSSGTASTPRKPTDRRVNRPPIVRAGNAANRRLRPTMRLPVGKSGSGFRRVRGDAAEQPRAGEERARSLGNTRTPTATSARRDPQARRRRSRRTASPASPPAATRIEVPHGHRHRQNFKRTLRRPRTRPHPGRRATPVSDHPLPSALRPARRRERARRDARKRRCVLRAPARPDGRESEQGQGDGETRARQAPRRAVRRAARADRQVIHQDGRPRRRARRAHRFRPGRG